MAYLPKIDFSESKPDQHLEAIRQEHESFLAELEGLAVEAIASNNWDAFYAHLIDFQNEHDLDGKSGIAIAPDTLELFFPRVSVTKNEANADRLHSSGADSLPSPPNELRIFPSCHNNHSPI